METVGSVSEFIKTVHRIRRHDWKVVPSRELWFRGEPGQYKKTRLRPNIYRLTDRRSTHVPTAEQIRRILDLECELYGEFCACAYQLSGTDPHPEDRDWDWYFLMRHHGAPTRLLDWTTGALIALHMALGDKLTEISRHGERGIDGPERERADTSASDTDDPSPRVYITQPGRLERLWVRQGAYRTVKDQWKKFRERHHEYDITLDDDDWDEAYLPMTADERKGEDWKKGSPVPLGLPSAPVVVWPADITRRVAAQRSRFMLFGRDPNWLADHLLKRSSKGKKELIKEIRVGATTPRAVRRMMIDLRDCGITESVVYPDLDGLGREMGHLWKLWQLEKMKKKK